MMKNIDCESFNCFTPFLFRNSCILTMICRRNRSFISLRHRSNFYDEFYQRCLIWVGEQLLDKSIATDYLPYLRSIAFHERVACDNAKKILNHDEDASTKRKRRKRKENPRPHYFQEFLSKYRKDQLEYVSSGLAKMHLTPR